LFPNKRERDFLHSSTRLHRAREGGKGGDLPSSEREKLLDRAVESATKKKDLERRLSSQEGGEKEVAADHRTAEGEKEKEYRGERGFLWKGEKRVTEEKAVRHP